MGDFAGLFQPPSLEAVYTQERCYIVEYMNTDLCGDVSVAQCRVESQVTTQLHQLRVAERYIIQQGRGLMELGQAQSFFVAAGDCVMIPAGCPQRIENVGDEPLIFLCICTPRFQAHHYVALEDDMLPGIAQP